MVYVESANTGFGNRFPSTCMPGVKAFIAWTLAIYGLGNLGCFSSTSTLSSGRWSWHKYGKAADIAANWYDLHQRAIGDRLWNYIMANREAFGLQQMIWGNRIYDISFGERIYHHDDHKNHLHIAFGYNAALMWAPSKTEVSVIISEELDVDYLMIDSYLPANATAKRIAIGNLRSAEPCTNPAQVDRYKAYRTPGANPKPLVYADGKGKVVIVPVDPVDMTAALSR